MSPALNGSTALPHFECGNTVEMCNGMMFGFYPGLPHILSDFQKFLGNYTHAQALEPGSIFPT